MGVDTDLGVGMIKAGAIMRDLTLDNAIRAIRGQPRR